MAGPGYRGALARCGRSVGIAKEGLKSCLLEVMIVCQRLGDAVSIHDSEGGAVRMAPGLVASLRIQSQRILKLHAGLGNDGDVWISAEALDQADRGAAQNFATLAVVIQEFRENHFTGDDPVAAEGLGERCRLQMESISGIQEGDPEIRIGEKKPHSSS